MAVRHHTYVADDHHAVRLGIQVALARSAFVVSAEADSMDAVAALLEQQVPDLLITDFSMPGERFGDGLGYLEHLHVHYPTLPVVVLTMVRRPVVLQAMLDCGVLALVDKGASLRLLPVAAGKALKGERYISEALTRLVEAPARRTGKGDLVQQARLSASERAVLELIGEGDTLTAIAETLDRSISTVSTLKTRAMTKLGLLNNADLLEFIRHQNTTPESGA
jgi:two-component system capsular synthesis response regulator RcsB